MRFRLQIHATGAAASSGSPRFTPSASVQALASHPLSDTGHHGCGNHLLHDLSFSLTPGVSLSLPHTSPPQLREPPCWVFLDDVEKAERELGTGPSSAETRTPRQIRRPLTSAPVPRHTPLNPTHQPACLLRHCYRAPRWWPESSLTVRHGRTPAPASPLIAATPPPSFRWKAALSGFRSWGGSPAPRNSATPRDALTRHRCARRCESVAGSVDQETPGLRSRLLGPRWGVGRGQSSSAGAGKAAWRLRFPQELAPSSLSFLRGIEALPSPAAAYLTQLLRSVYLRSRVPCSHNGYAY